MRLIIADINSTNRLALQMYLHQEKGMYVIGVASTAQGLSAQIEATQPEVLLLDWHLPGASMSELLTGIRALKLPPKVIVLSVNPEVEARASSAGADAFFNKNAPNYELLDLLRSFKNTSANSINQ